MRLNARLVFGLTLVWVCSILVWTWTWWMPRRISPRDSGHLTLTSSATPRIVSLSPAITETLFALGAGDLVVGVTSRCDYPPGVTKLARVGPGTHPNLEAIVRLHPTLILGETSLRLAEEMLTPLAPTRLLPWLTPSEIVRSVKEIGVLVGRQPRAEELARRMARPLLAAPRAAAPRVLMLFADKPGQAGPIYFVKPGSLHDALLTAAGARNAVEGAVRGAPIISAEGILRLDPDAVLILVSYDYLSPEERSLFLADFEKLTVLRAVRERHLRVLNGSILLVTGPRVLVVIEQIAAALRDMGLAPAGQSRP